jgi:hypothetical protein
MVVGWAPNSYSGDNMKVIATAMLVAAVVVLTGPVLAQDRGDASKMGDRHDTPVRHKISNHRVTYRRTYKTDQEEHQATEDLNRQYRGVPSSDAH